MGSKCTLYISLDYWV